MTIGEALKNQREINGYSQSALAKATGLKQQMISWWEADKGLPNIDFCIKLAKFYGVSLNELVGLDAVEQNGDNIPVSKPSSEIATYVSEYSELIKDKNFKDVSKLYKAAVPELRAIALGYLIALFEQNGMNTRAVLGR